MTLRKQLDRLDPIRSCRDLFRFPADAGSNEQVIYLVGNSLGLQPKAVESEMQKQLQRWANLGVRGHFEGDPGWIRWVDRPNEIMAQLVGADKNDVAIMNTLSVNLHLLLATFYKPTKKRYKILIEQSAFPSDQYVVRSQAAWHGFDPDDAVIECPTQVGVFSLESFDRVLEESGEEIAMVLLGGVNYVSGQYLDLAEITSRAKSYGCVVGF